MKPLGFGSAAIALALVALAPGCASTVDDGDVPADKLATTLHWPTLVSARTYNAFATEGGGFGQAGRIMKYFVDVREGAKTTFFINSNYKVNGKVPDYAIYHYDFAKEALHIPDTQVEFNDGAYYRNEKSYFSGTIQTYTLGEETEPTYAIQFYPDDVVHEEGILQAARILRPQIRIPGVKLAFVATGPQQTFARVTTELRQLGIEPMTIDQVLGSVKYLPLNAGEAWGYLRIFPQDQKTLRATDIPVFDELPLDLAVVAGTITRSFQDVTSHVNLKSKERGTPNMVLRDASPTHPQLSKFADQPVHLVVGKTGYTLEETTAEIVQQKYNERNNTPWKELPVVTEPSLVTYDAMCPTLSGACVHDGGRFGGKATNLGFLANREVLGRASHSGSTSALWGYDLTPYGSGVPVARYRDFVAANPAVKQKVDELVAKEKSGALTRADRETLVTELQQLFYKGVVPSAQLADVNAVVYDLATRFPTMDELKFRSSSNAEDIPNFDGAGLHDSFSVKLSARDNPDLSCALDPEIENGVVTKLKIRPKTPQCAIKAVYASLWNTRAIEERSFARLDHATSAMGLAIVPAYDTESEVVANGVVITRVINGEDILGYTLSLQQGNNLVTNPAPGSIAQMTLVTFSADASRPDRFTVTRYATPAAGAPPLTQSVLSESKMAEVVAIARAVEQPYCAVEPTYNGGKCAAIHMNNKKAASLDMEFKVLANGHVVLKQVREFHGQ